MNKTYSAYNVMHAIYYVYLCISNDFLKKCGADFNKPKEQLLNVNCIKEVANAMLDKDTEKMFWNELNAQIKTNAKIERT